MHYDYLCEFAVTARCGSLSVAAAELNMSQPSLCRHLASLEAELHARLFERGPSGFKLLPAGESVAEAAAQVFDLAQTIELHFKDEKRRDSERYVTFGLLCESNDAVALLEKCCALAGERGYDVRMRRMLCGSPDDAVLALERGTIDVALCYRWHADRLGSMTGIAIDALIDIPAVVAFEVGHDLAKRGSLAVKDLQGCAFSSLVRDTQPGLWEEFVRACGERGLALPRTPYFEANGYGMGGNHAGGALVASADSPAAVRLASNRTVLPVVDAKLEVCALSRVDDDFMRGLLGQASELAKTRAERTAVDHQSMYGAIAKDGPVADQLGRGTSDELLARVRDEPKVSHDLVLPDGRVVDKSYVALRNRLNRIADGLSNDPVETSYDAIMNLWSVEEAKAELEMPLLEWFTAYDFAAVSGRDVDECERLLDDLSHRSLIYRVTRGGVRYYYLLAWTYGIWESQVRNYGSGFLDMGIYGYDLGSGSQYPTMRVCPVDARAIPGGRVEPYCDWESYIRRQTKVCLAPCQCRASKALIEAGCLDCENNNDGVVDPMEVCLTFGEMAEFWLENGSGREISVDECLDLARDAVYAHKMIPQVIFDKNPEVMCFCKADGCYVLAAVRSTCGLAQSKPKMSMYDLAFDNQACVRCGSCKGVCPMEAVSLDAQELPVTAATCVGCGHCVLTCPAGARKLVVKEDDESRRLPDDLSQDYRWRSEDRMARGYITDFTDKRIGVWSRGR